MNREKVTVALSSMAASALMALGKFVVGLLTGSLGLLSEALHSLLDFGATVLTFLAVRISDKPADAEHPYGHGKAESVAALAETGLLFVTSVWIVWAAAHRLIAGDYHVEATWWSIAVVLASIAIDASRVRALRKVAKKTGSQALEADALHFSSDILSSFCVLVGLGGVALGWPEADAVAAIGVSLFVCHAGWRLGRKTVDTLLDAAPSGATERLRAIVIAVEGVAAVKRVRVRPAGSVLFVDIDLAVGRSLSLVQVTNIRERVVAAVLRAFPNAEITVTAHPLALDDETVHQRVIAIAAVRGVGVHHVTAHRSDGRLSVGFDLELPGKMPLGVAHAAATLLESDIRAEFGEDVEVESHIEPLQEYGSGGYDLSDDESATAIRASLESAAAATGILSNVHSVRVRNTDLGLVVLFRCQANPARTVAEVHDAVDAVERELRRSLTGIWRILTHAEPA